MDIQRLRNLTTGMLHTEIGHVYEDLEWITGEPGIMTHMIPNVCRAIEPWLREKVTDGRFWDGTYDPSHTGDFLIAPMTKEEASQALQRFAQLPSPLLGKNALVVVVP